MPKKFRTSFLNTLIKWRLIENFEERDEKEKEGYLKEQKRVQITFGVALFIAVCLKDFIYNLGHFNTLFHTIVFIIFYLSIWMVINKISLKMKQIKTTRN